MKWIITLVFLSGCAAGISLNLSGTESVGGLPGAPTTGTLSTAALCSPGFVTSDSGNLSGVLCIDPTSFQGVKEGTAVSASNPFIETGIDQVSRGFE